MQWERRVVVVHSGSCAKISRQQALQLAADTPAKERSGRWTRRAWVTSTCARETMGKLNQLGDLEEVLTLCTLDERLIPCIDFGHLNARALVRCVSQRGWNLSSNTWSSCWGMSGCAASTLTFPRSSTPQPGGEKRHLTFADTVFGPSFEPLAELLCKKNALPTIICESAGTQAEDALWMKEFYQDCLRQQGGKSE